MLEAILAVVTKQIAQEVLGIIRDEIKAVVSEAMFRTEAFTKADQKAQELIADGKKAKTLEEKDAILDQLLAARPKFS